MKRYGICFALIAVLTSGAAAAVAQAAAEAPPPPTGFTAFAFAGHADAAKTLNDYLWYHFYQRLGNSITLFNKEYLSVSDLWLAGARERGTDRPIQDVHREALLGAWIDPEGYVHTHQHFSHAHDHGWPFPLWTQSDHGDKMFGKTAGWHFQPLEQVPGWVGDHLRNWQHADWTGESAAAAWTLENAQSRGIVNNRWRIEATGPSPAAVSPEGVHIEAWHAPFLQIRWTRTGAPPQHESPYLEWQREGDAGFGADRRMYFYPDKTPLSADLYHSILPLYRHPLWRGTITRLRFALAPGEDSLDFDVDSIFTVYDTRHTINNPILILASYWYFSWTGDTAFLREQINRLRIALRYQQTVFGGLENNFIRVTWPGHDARPGWTKSPDGRTTVHGGHGIGNNYWDIMPFGGDDFYATYQYYAATLALASLEEAILANPGWDCPLGALAQDPAELRRHAAAVRETANTKFWSDEAGRFVAAIDPDGNAYDYGYTFLNLDAIWYGIATEEHAKDIMGWLTGARTVDGDTSTGANIYHWRFGPRATTRRNLTWYGQGWSSPESIPFGAQVQDGGAVLGFTFYDLWARLHVLGPEDAWKRLSEILDWETEVRAAGGYRAYYADGQQGTTLQGGGTAGGLGIDAEFFESSLLPSIVPYGFLGFDARPDALHIAPRLPESCPEMTVRNLLYRNTPIDVTASIERVTISVKSIPVYPLTIVPGDAWSIEGHGESAGALAIEGPGEYVLTRTGG